MKLGYSQLGLRLDAGLCSQCPGWKLCVVLWTRQNTSTCVRVGSLVPVAYSVLLLRDQSPSMTAGLTSMPTRLSTRPSSLVGDQSRAEPGNLFALLGGVGVPKIEMALHLASCILHHAIHCAMSITNSQACGGESASSSFVVFAQQCVCWLESLLS